MEITNDTKIDSLNQLAAICNVQTLEALAAELSASVGKPIADVVFRTPQGKPIPHTRTLPAILTGHSGCTVRVARADVRRAVTFGFPQTVGALDDLLLGLCKYKSPEQEAFEAFEQALLDGLDGYGHLTWTVGTEDWLACADAVLGRYQGKLYLAHHVVVDCESGSFTDTIEKAVTLVEGAPPQGILSQYLDNCCEFYLGREAEGEEFKIDFDGSTRAIEEFDAHIKALWSNDPAEPVDLALDYDEEGQESFDPAAMGWVGADGRP